MANLRCSVCWGDDLEDADDGFFYCRQCGSRADDIVDTGVADEDFVDKGDAGGAVYLASHKRKKSFGPTPFSQQIKSEPGFEPESGDAVGPTEPADFGWGSQLKFAVAREEDYYRVTRQRYVMGVQVMVQLQCEALVKKFGVNPVVCGIVGSIWVRFVASTGVFEDGWAYEAMTESESQGKKRSDGRKTYEGEPRNIYNERMVIVWIKSLKKTIPLSCSLAVSFLACHIAREPVLPTDILRWTVEGKLPYFGAFTEIETSLGMLDDSVKNVEIYAEMLDKSIKNIMISIGKPSIACPLSASHMFRPSQAVPLQKLESMAASIAQSIGLNLPPVNFHAIASRYLKQLSLPMEKIIPYACRIYEWSMPPDVWLSASELRLPTRVCVMSILVVAIRILYNINGFGKWEMTLSAPIGPSSMDDQVTSSDPTCKSNRNDDAEGESTSQGLDGEPGASWSSVHKFESECPELLHNLEKRYDEIIDKYEYSQDLPTYLQYCKDVVFAGSCRDIAEEKLIEQLWDYYQKNREDNETFVELETGLNQKRSRDDDYLFKTPLQESKKHRDEEATSTSADSAFFSQDVSPECGQSGDDAPQSSQANQTSTVSGQPEVSSQNLKDIAIRHMKIDMEEHRFCYIPPRVNVKRKDYLHYVRKRDDGSLTYVAHADYYILLRACAKVAHVDVRVMHAGVLSLERRLRWIENRIDYCMQEKCLDKCAKSDTDLMDECVGLSNLNV